jgi:Pvc16 N-terminal domain/Carboxypeptidase regulatory-like domain
MFQDLDATLATILGNGAAPAELQAADVSFEPPDKNFAPVGPTLNLFLYEVKENRELRDPQPIVVQSGASFVRRMPPLRVEGVYLVTTWSDKTGAAKIAEEHLLLGQAIAWLSRFPVIPASFLQGSLAAPPQPFPPPMMVAQVEANKNAGEFWSALGSTPRPGFYLSVTISIDLGLEIPEGPPVVTKEMILKEKMPPGVIEPVLADFFEIGGIVRDANTLAPIANAGVTLVELERATTTDAEGRFRLNNLEAGNYTLRTVAAGFSQSDTAIVVPGAVLNAYDVNLSP